MNLLKKSYNLSHELTLFKKPTLSSDTIEINVYDSDEEEDMLYEGLYLDEDGLHLDEDGLYLNEAVLTDVTIKDNANIPYPLNLDCECTLDLILNEKADETVESLNTELTTDDLKRFLNFYVNQRPHGIVELEKKMEDSTRYLLFTKAVEYVENIIDRSLFNDVLHRMFDQPKTEEPLEEHPLLTKDKDLYTFRAFIYLHDDFIETDHRGLIPNPEHIDFQHEKSDDQEPLGEIVLRFTLNDEE